LNREGDNVLGHPSIFRLMAIKNNRRRRTPVDPHELSSGSSGECIRGLLLDFKDRDDSTTTQRKRTSWPPLVLPA